MRAYGASLDLADRTAADADMDADEHGAERESRDYLGGERGRRVVAVVQGLAE